MQIKTKAVTAAVAVLSLALFVCAAPKEARADDTGAVLLGAALGVAGTAIYENVLHKQQAASQVVGYTSQGCAVYADGHVGCNNAGAGTPTVATPAGYGRYGAGTYGSGAGRYAAGSRYGYGRYAGTAPASYGRRTAESTYGRRR